MTTYRVYYMTKESWPVFMLGDALPSRAHLLETHVFLREVEADSLEDVFMQSQSEIWSPNGEARELIQSKGLVHTSISIGDVVQNTESGEFWAVGRIGFHRIPLNPVE